MLNFLVRCGAKVRKSCRSRKMRKCSLSEASNEPYKVPSEVFYVSLRTLRVQTPPDSSSFSELFVGQHGHIDCMIAQLRPEKRGGLDVQDVELVVNYT